MQRLLTYCIFLLFTLVISSFSLRQDEKYPFSKWDTKVIEKAQSAYTEEEQMDENEKQVIYYCNLARLNPKLFGQTYVQKYLDENQLKSSWTASLLRDLNKVKKLDVLKFDKSLYTCAKNHAETNGKKGLEGHQNYNARFKKYAPQFRVHGENCDYGNQNALDIVMSLLIDEDVPGNGHRNNILNTEFKYVGVAIAPHKEHEYNAVMCFGG